MQSIDSLRFQAEDFLRAQTLMSYNTWVHGTPSRQDSLYRTNAGLFRMENVALVARAELEEQDSLQKRRLRSFRRYLVTEYLEHQVASLRDSIHLVEATATVTAEGLTIPYRELHGIIANEPLQRRRAALWPADMPVLDTLNLLYGRIHEATYQLTRELGFSSFNTMQEELAGFSFPELKAQAERVLAETDSIYTALLEQYLRSTLQVDPGAFSTFDTGRLFRSTDFDRYFPHAAAIKTLAEVYRGIGIDIERQSNLRIDSEPRPEKNPRAACFPIEIPGDIRLSVKPLGGFDDYAALFHEMGHGQHYANTREAALEFTRLGEPTTTETYAFLSEYLLANQAWLRISTRMPVLDLKDLIRHQVLTRLYLVRRYCTKFLFELQLHEGVPNPGRVYARMLSSSLRLRTTPSDEKRHFTDTDANYYTASYLRAWFLEAQLNARLREQYGANWFENPAAGEFLRTLWAFGDRLNGEDLARQLGFVTITPDALMQEIRGMLHFSSR